MYIYMFMTLFRWQARILNTLYKTDRYNSLSNLNLTSPDQINYSLFYQMTPGINAYQHTQVIDAANKLCRINTKASQMQLQVAFLDQYIKKINELSNSNNHDKDDIKNIGKQQNNNNIGNQFSVDHVVVYSTLSKCRIWPKVLKSGIGFVPTLINFYNSFTKQYSDWLDFKFDPVILSQKYTKIMKKAHLKKRDHPKLIQAVQQNNIDKIKAILSQLKQEQKKKSPIQSQQKQQNSDEQNNKQYASILNNISHKGLAISHIAAQNSSLDTIKYLHQLGADFQLLDDEKQTSVFYAVKRADLTIVKYFVQVLKVDLNHRQYQDRTLLYLAAFQGELEIVDYLYKMGADPELSSKLDRTPMSKACYLGNVKVVKYLLTLKVDILKQDNKGRTALHNAVWGIQGGRDGKRRGHIMLEDSPQCAQLLLQAGHPIDFEDYDGFTPLFSAVSSCAVRSLRLLVQRGANLLHKTKNKQTAVFIGAKYGHLPVLKILIQQHKLDYIQPDYHGYSPLCATVTLDDPKSFCYLADLYLKDKRELGFENFVRCCRQYETENGLGFVKYWINCQSQNKQISKQDKIIYLSKHLLQITKIVANLKKQKKVFKSQLAELQQKFAAIKAKQYNKYASASKGIKNNESKVQQTVEKQNSTKNQLSKTQQKSQKINKKQQNTKQQQMMSQTERNNMLRAAQKQRQKQRQLTFYAIRDKQKQIESVRKLISILVTTVADVVKGLQTYIKSEINKLGMEYNQTNMQLMRHKLVENYNSIYYKMSVLFILSECVHAFNKDKPSYIGNIVQSMLQLAKVINTDNPAIPPIFTSSQSTQQQKPQQHQSVLLHNHLLILAQQSSVSPSQLCHINLHHFQNQSQILKLLTNTNVITNLTSTLQQVTDTMFRLAKLRFIGVVIGIFNNQHVQLGNTQYQQLIDIVSGKHNIHNHTHTQQQQQHKRLTLIQFCILNNIADLAVFLQQLCKSHNSHNNIRTLVQIPTYLIKTIQLTEPQTNIQLQAVQPWVFSLQALVSRISQNQINIYRRFIDFSQQQRKDRNIQETKVSMQMIQTNQQLSQQHKYRKYKNIKFQSCMTYKIVDNKPKLQQMRTQISKSVLIGIDVQHYNTSKQQCFICSIQISCGESVFIIDTLAHLSSSLLKQKQQTMMMPQDIAIFMRELMQDQSKVKIYHAYQNDVKWLHQDFNLQSAEHRNRNVIDTSKLYNLCNRVKKGVSIGLRTLAKQYVNYDMDKNFQRSDWRIRPLFKEMIQYAAIDAEILPYVYLRMLSESSSQTCQRFVQNFSYKHSMKSRGIRNRLFKKQRTQNNQK